MRELLVYCTKIDIHIGENMRECEQYSRKFPPTVKTLLQNEYRHEYKQHLQVSAETFLNTLFTYVTQLIVIRSDIQYPL